MTHPARVLPTRLFMSTLTRPPRAELLIAAPPRPDATAEAAKRRRELGTQ